MQHYVNCFASPHPEIAILLSMARYGCSPRLLELGICHQVFGVHTDTGTAVSRGRTDDRHVDRR